MTTDKAKVGAAVSALLGAVCVALAAYFQGNNGITVTGVVAAFGAGVAVGVPAGLAVFYTPNKPKVE